MWKIEDFTSPEKIFRQINFFILVNTVLSRNFRQYKNALHGLVGRKRSYLRLERVTLSLRELREIDGLINYIVHCFHEIFIK